MVGEAVAMAPRRAVWPWFAPAILMMVALVSGSGSAVVERSSPSAADAPLAFVTNAGQTDARVRFMARGAGYAFYFTPAKVVLDLQRGNRGQVLELRFRGANPHPQIVGEQRTGARINYIIGTSRHTNLAAFSQLRYRDLWPGIDMVLRGQGGTLKYEFVVRPGANPADIQLAYAGADSLTRSTNGALAIGTPLGTLRDQAPHSFQGGASVDSRYAVSGLSYGFALAGYDKSRTLTIDPGLLYSTYLGGIDADYPAALAVDGSGNAYVGGQTKSASFPTTPGAYDLVVDGATDGFVSKLNGAGQLVYSTYLGGSSDDFVRDIAVDGSGSAYAIGTTTSANFPTTPGAYDETPAPSGSSFVTKLNPSGAGLGYSTVFPDNVSQVAVTSGGNAFLGGDTTGNVPVSASAPDQTVVGIEAFVAKLNTAGSAIDWSTYIGGRGNEGVVSLALDGAEEPYAMGTTTSLEQFPFTPGAMDTTNEGENLYVTKVDGSGNSFDYSTLFSTSSFGVSNPVMAVDAAGFVYLTGSASSGIPLTPGAYDTTTDPSQTGCSFIAKLNQAGSALVYGTRLGVGMCNADHIAVDSAGNAYVTLSQQDGGDLKTVPGAFDSHRNGIDVFLFKLNAAGTAQLYSSYLGGSGTEFAADLEAVGTNSVIITGHTGSNDFPTTATSHDQSYNGNDDGFVTKLQTYEGYPRPKGATPLRLSLVIAYKPRSCSTSQELQHGPPYAYSSCPPQKESPNATVGTGDSNGKPARMEGFLRFDSMLGNPATPADEADMKIEFFMDDVFDATTLDDYPYQLRSLFTVRMTDRNFGDSAMATTQDYLFPLFANCVPTADTLEGSTCTLSTTVESIVGPGGIVEGKRSVWGIDNVRVFDSGADGDARVVGDTKVLARPGFVVP